MNTDRLQPRAVMFLRARHIGADDRKSRSIEQAALAAQREACWQAADGLGAQLVCEYIELGGTGSIAKRPTLRLLLDELRMVRDVRYVIVSAADRLTRSISDQHAIAFELEAAGAELIITNNLPTRKEVSV